MQRGSWAWSWVKGGTSRKIGLVRDEQTEGKKAGEHSREEAGIWDAGEQASHHLTRQDGRSGLQCLEGGRILTWGDGHGHSRYRRQFETRLVIR